MSLLIGVRSMQTNCAAGSCNTPRHNPASHQPSDKPSHRARNGSCYAAGTLPRSAEPAVSIKIEGNTDERGGAEYNLALGQKRAEAVSRALKIFGVKDAQMEAVSFGKEKPKVLGHDDASYAQNRRADLDYPAK